MRTRALEHTGEPLSLVMEVVLGLGAQCAQDASGGKPRDAKPLGECPKRFAIADASPLGHAIEIIGWDQLGVHREGGRRRQVELINLLTDITRDELDSRLHFRHHPLGFLEAFHTALAQSFVLGNDANLLDVPLDISGNESAVSAHPALQIDKMVVVAHATDARLDLFTLLSEARVLATGHFERVLGLLQAHGFLWAMARTALFGLVTYALRGALQPFELLSGFGDGLARGPLFGGHGTGDRFDELGLPMEQVR